MSEWNAEPDEPFETELLTWVVKNYTVWDIYPDHECARVWYV